MDNEVPLKNCKYCNKDIKARNFCNEQCRNNFVSEIMIEKAKKIKGTIGNKYYRKEHGKQKEDNSIK